MALTGSTRQQVLQLMMTDYKATTYDPFLVVALGDFNGKFCNWCINDKTNFEGAKTDTLTSQNGLHQTHILDGHLEILASASRHQHRH